MSFKIENEGDKNCPNYKIYMSEDFNFDSDTIYTESNMKDIYKLQNRLIKILGYDESNIYIENICMESNNKLKYKFEIDYLEGIGVERSRLKTLIENPDTDIEFSKKYHDYINSIEYVIKDIINEITINEKIKMLKDLVKTKKYNELEKYIVGKILEEYDFKKSKEYNYINIKKIIEHIVSEYNIFALENISDIENTYAKYSNLINEIKDEKIMNCIKSSQNYEIEEEQLLCLAYIKTIKKFCEDLNLEYLTMDITNKSYNIF